MKVLFVSGELIAGDLAYRLKKEGCEVRLYIKDKSRKDCFDCMLHKIDDWKKEREWVGKDGLIVFDDVGYGKEQDELRSQGYNVVGGSFGGDRLEKERAYGQRIMSVCGIKTLETHDFLEVQDAIDFIKKNKGAWVIKQNGHQSAMTYVGTMEDGGDALCVLESYKCERKDISSISIQKKACGIEIAAGRYFNGDDWVGPIEINIEHKRLFDGDIGPLTGEMGTLTWYEEDERNKLFQETLAKLKPYLQWANFRGDVDVNCIVNEDSLYPLEVTARFGCPSTQLQTEIHLSPWSEFLMAIAKGKKYSLKYRKGFGVVISIAIPPFPYKSIDPQDYLKGTAVLFHKKLTKEQESHLHFEEVCSKKISGKSQLSVAGSNGFIMYVTGFGKTVQEARREAYGLVKNIVIPKMFYRSDIGLRFVQQDEKLLRKWGWI